VAREPAYNKLCCAFQEDVWTPIPTGGAQDIPAEYLCVVLQKYHSLINHATAGLVGSAVAQRLMCCATNRKVTGSIPDGVIGIFH